MSVFAAMDDEQGGLDVAVRGDDVRNGVRVCAVVAVQSQARFGKCRSTGVPDTRHATRDVAPISILLN